MAATDRFYLWVGVNLTATSATAFSGELDIEGTLNGNFDSNVVLPLGTPGANDYQSHAEHRSSCEFGGDCRNKLPQHAGEQHSEFQWDRFYANGMERDVNNSAGSHGSQALGRWW